MDSLMTFTLLCGHCQWLPRRRFCLTERSLPLPPDFPCIWVCLGTDTVESDLTRVWCQLHVGVCVRTSVLPTGAICIWGDILHHMAVSCRWMFSFLLGRCFAVGAVGLLNFQEPGDNCHPSGCAELSHRGTAAGPLQYLCCGRDPPLCPEKFEVWEPEGGGFCLQKLTVVSAE